MRLRLAILALVLVAGFASCKKEPPPPPPPTTRPAPTLIACVSGYGNPQLHDVANHIAKEFPNENTVDFGTGVHSYLLDPAKYVSENPHQKIIFVGHSYGCDATKTAAAKMTQPIELLILIDPVPWQIFGTLTIPSNVKRCVVIWADKGIFIRANVKYPTVEYRVKGEHSEICHKLQTLEIVEREVREALQ